MHNLYMNFCLDKPVYIQTVVHSGVQQMRILTDKIAEFLQPLFKFDEIIFVLFPDEEHDLESSASII